MPGAIKSDIAIKDLFGLDERQDVERVESSSDILYLLRGDDILRGRKLAIDEQHGMVGVYETLLTDKIEMNSQQTALLTLLMLSRPLPVQQWTLHSLYTLYMPSESEQKPDSKSLEDAVQAFIVTCNEKLDPLGITIEKTNAVYSLTATSVSCESGKMVFHENFIQ
jgi:hypothetical protein